MTRTVGDSDSCGAVHRKVRPKQSLTQRKRRSLWQLHPSVQRPKNLPDPRLESYTQRKKDWKVAPDFIWRSTIKFNPAYVEPPTLISGLSRLDTTSKKEWHADTRHMNVTRGQATGICRSIGEGHYWMHSRWLTLPKTDKPIETGVYEFAGDEATSPDDKMGRQTSIFFSKPFAQTPVVLVWLCDLLTGPDLRGLGCREERKHHQRRLHFRPGLWQEKCRTKPGQLLRQTGRLVRL
ncbi:hypothetical protein PMIN05_007219 [Paraphaeosphaeria minitans]